jgi:4-alpha-glucanotransferase
MMRRGSGIQIPVPSLPSAFGIGDMGPGAYRFADFLRQAGQRYWQILPLNLPNPAWGSSPYSCLSAFAGNIYLLSPEIMVQEGFVSEGDIGPASPANDSRIDYVGIYPFKDGIFQKAWSRFQRAGVKEKEFFAFSERNADWLDDLTLFISLKKHFGGRAWNEWPGEIAYREPEALAKMSAELEESIEMEKFLQYLFFDQWMRIRRYCNEQGIEIVGDIPIYINYDSADVWKNPEFFKLDRDCRPVVKAGVPPDYFSETGQLWGNPLYRWDVMKDTGYDWWVRRMRINLELYDIVRIDHFRGLVACWEVPAGENTAVNGRWVEGPGEDFFHVLLRHFAKLPIIAEDLGTITQDVRELLERFDFPGMRVLLFAFGDDFPHGLYLPHNYAKNCLATTGTHDTNTVRGWFKKEATKEQKERVREYLGREVTGETACRELIRLAMMSVADVSIIPIQDFLGLGDESRLNKPATAEGNWEWRLSADYLTLTLAEEMATLTGISGRAGDSG